VAETPVILIVEDSPTQAQELAARIFDRGLEAIIANDGPQALRLVDVYKPDLIVLDVNLPSMTGYQVCDRLRRDPNTADIPIIMLTSASSSDEIQTGYRSGADAYISKGGFAFDLLFSTMARMGIEMVNAYAST
jgi:CheY-like chemotaxis protein